MKQSPKANTPKIRIEEIVPVQVGNVQIINVTPHPMNFETPDGEIVTVPPSGFETRARVNSISNGTFGGAELIISEYEGTEVGKRLVNKLADYNPDAIIVGSALSAKAYPGIVFKGIPVRRPEGNGFKVMRSDRFEVF